MENIERLQPRAFTKFCMSIGMVPSSYTSALTYEEQLLWFCSYLEKEVIPAVNNNAEALQEVQNLMVQLQDYVNHYFDNLDVQEEINNKLDEMVESGEFDNILAEYIGGEINFYFPAIANQELDNTEVGNSCFIKTENKVVVIDTMMREDNFNKVAQAMNEAGVTKIDYFIISHLDYDHYSNLPLFIEAFDCSETLFLLPRVPNNVSIHDDYQNAYDYIVDTLTSNNITNYRFADNESIQVDKVTMKLFNASVSDLNYYDTLGVQYNNYSICTEFDYKNKKALFVGDLLEDGQKHVREEEYIGSNYDLMQDCHHSFSSYDEIFMNTVRPKTVVAPTGKGFWSQIYKFAPTLDFYSSYNANIYVLGFQENTLQFKLNSFGLEVVSNSISLNGLKVNMSYKNFYVDSETEDTLHAGTIDHPFKDLKEAVSLISKEVPNKANINIVNLDDDELSETIEIRYAQDWVIVGNNKTLPNLKIINSSIELRNCVFANSDDNLAIEAENSRIIFYGVSSTSSATKFIECRYSDIYVGSTLTLSNKGTAFRIFNDSQLTIDATLTLSSVTTFISALTSKIVIRPTPLTTLKTVYTNPTNIISPNDFKQCTVSENLNDLYELWSGTQSDFTQITLKDSVANYEYVEIYYLGKYVGCNYIKVPKAEYGLFSLKGIHISGGQDTFISSNTQAALSGTGISVTRCVNYNVTSSGISNFNNTNEIVIKKIVGVA